jgi:hypothetical protein
MKKLFGVSRARLHKLEHRADVLRAAVIGRTEQVAVGVGDQAGEGRISIPQFLVLPEASPSMGL